MNSEQQIIQKFNEMLDLGATQKELQNYIIDFYGIIYYDKKGLSLPTLQYLLQKIDAEEKYINHIFQACCCEDRVENLVSICNNYNININNQRAMGYAITYARLDVIKFLIDSGYDIISNKDKIFFDALHGYDEISVLKYFFDLGLVPEEKHLKYRSTCPKITKIYLEAGIDPEKITELYLKHLSKDYVKFLEKFIILAEWGVDLNKQILEFKKEFIKKIDFLTFEDIFYLLKIIGN